MPSPLLQRNCFLEKPSPLLLFVGRLGIFHLTSFLEVAQLPSWKPPNLLPGIQLTSFLEVT